MTIVLTPDDLVVVTPDDVDVVTPDHVVVVGPTGTIVLTPDDVGALTPDGVVILTPDGAEGDAASFAMGSNLSATGTVTGGTVTGTASLTMGSTLSATGTVSVGTIAGTAALTLQSVLRGRGPAGTSTGPVPGHVPTGYEPVLDPPTRRAIFDLDRRATLTEEASARADAAAADTTQGNLPWTPTFAGLTVGTGANEAGRYSFSNGVLSCWYRVILGTSPTVGVISPDIPSGFEMDLGSFRNPLGTVQYVDANGGTFFGYVRFLSLTSVRLSHLYVTGSEVRVTTSSATVPFTWAAGDAIGFEFNAPAHRT